MGVQGYPWRRAKAGHQTHTVRDRVELLAGGSNFFVVFF